MLSLEPRRGKWVLSTHTTHGLAEMHSPSLLPLMTLSLAKHMEQDGR